MRKKIFLEFDGFSDEQPIQIREEMRKDVSILDEFKEDSVLLVKNISQSFGISIEDVDIKFHIRYSIKY